MYAFFDYIRNITYYLMFATVVGMLAPTGKYKKFVSLVMGFIMLSMMIQPLARFATEIPVTDWFNALAPSNENHISNDLGYYEQWRNTYLRTAFEAQLSTQLTALLMQNNFTVHEVSFTFADDFSAIYTTRATISQREEEAQRVPFIRIQPVHITRQNHSPETVLPCPTATAAKNLISQFYNLPLEHIYVSVVP